MKSKRPFVFLHFLKKLLFDFEKLNDENKDIQNQLLIRDSGGGSFFCPSSLSMVIGILISCSPSFDSIVRAATIGGDTDSNAAMVGGIIGGMNGLESLNIPFRYINNLYEKDMLFHIAKNLANLF